MTTFIDRFEIFTAGGIKKKYDRSLQPIFFVLLRAGMSIWYIDQGGEAKDEWDFNLDLSNAFKRNAQIWLRMLVGACIQIWHDLKTLTDIKYARKDQ